MTRRAISVRLSKGQVDYLEEKAQIFGTLSDVIRAFIPEKRIVKNFEKIARQK